VETMKRNSQAVIRRISMLIVNKCCVTFLDRSKPNFNYAHHLLRQQESQHIYVSCGTQHKYTLHSWREYSLQSPVFTSCTSRFNIKKVYVLPTVCIYVFRTTPKTNNKYFS